MHQKRLAYGLMAAFSAFASAEDASDVETLTKDTFKDFIKGNELVLAECKFYIPVTTICCITQPASKHLLA